MNCNRLNCMCVDSKRIWELSCAHYAHHLSFFCFLFVFWINSNFRLQVFGAVAIHHLLLRSVDHLVSICLCFRTCTFLLTKRKQIHKTKMLKRTSSLTVCSLILMCLSITEEATMTMKIWHEPCLSACNGQTISRPSRNWTIWNGQQHT